MASAFPPRDLHQLVSRMHTGMRVRVVVHDFHNVADSDRARTHDVRAIVRDAVTCDTPLTVYLDERIVGVADHATHAVALHAITTRGAVEYVATMWRSTAHAPLYLFLDTSDEQVAAYRECIFAHPRK